MKRALLALSSCLLIACPTKTEVPEEGTSLTVHATWTIAGGNECPAQSRVVLTAGGESKSVACTDLEATLTDLDPAITTAFGRLLDVSGIEINRVSVQLGAPTDRIHEVAFPFTLPLAFGPYRVTVLWTVATALGGDAGCALVNAKTMHIVLGPRAPVDVPCSTGFYQFYNVGGTQPVSVELRDASGVAISSKSSTVSITDTIQLTYNFAENLCVNGCPMGTVDLDGDATTGTCGCEYNCTATSITDAVDSSVFDSNCDGSDWVVADCLYVDNTLLMSGTGTRAAPFNTIADAIGPAGPSGSKHSICVAGGTYPGTVALMPGTNLIGGFDRTAGYKRSAAVTTTISAPGTAVTVLGTAAATTIAGLTIVATNVGLPAGASVYGVRVSMDGAASLLISYCSIDTNNAIAGAAGATGANGLSGGVGVDALDEAGAIAPMCGMTVPVGNQGLGGTGVAISAGGDGFDGVSASASPNGAVACGDAGGPGVQGVTGTTGSDAAVVSNTAQSLVASTGVFAGVNGQQGTNGSRGSYGGGGGAGGALAGACANSDAGGGGGSGGCGGAGGAAGTQGFAGGAAIGVVIANGNVSFDHCTITTGAGGNGGNGGLGGNGGFGGLGGLGAAGVTGGTGGAGGLGGAGGRGANASGGAGGPSACYARGTGLGSGLVTVASLTCTPGAGGLGGTLGGPTGPRSASGFSGQELVIDALP